MSAPFCLRAEARSALTVAWSWAAAFSNDGRASGAADADVAARTSARDRDRTIGPTSVGAFGPAAGILAVRARRRQAKLFRPGRDVEPAAPHRQDVAAAAVLRVAQLVDLNVALGLQLLVGHREDDDAVDDGLLDAEAAHAGR